MIAKAFPSYEDYSHGQADFLPKVPSHWEVIRTGALFREIVDTGHPDLELLSINRFIGITKQSETGRKVRASSDRSAYKRILPGDLGYNLMNAFMGSIGVSDQEGLLSPAYAVARSRRKIEPNYFHYLYRTPLYQGQFARHSYGIMYERNRLYFDRFKTIPVLIPSLAEQQKIVTYLQARDGEIGRMLRNKRRLIEVLNEQKQTIIHRAVTGGLKQGELLQSSGIDWLGNVPVRWEVRPLKYWAHINQLTLTENTPEEYRFRYIDIGSVGTRKLVREPEEMTFSAAPSRARRVIRQGDTILSTVRTYLRAVYFFREEVSDLVGSTGFAVLTPRRGVDPEFLSLVIQGNAFIDRVTASSLGIAYPAIAESVLGAFHIPMPKEEREQKEIVAWIAKELAPVEEALEKEQRELELIREYRDSLITEVVTGQIDVRGLLLTNGKSTDKGQLSQEWAETDYLEYVDEENGDN